jgi:outer membrane lipoprotein SlyB
MKNKFVLTEEETKRILSLHKEKIQEERGVVSEQDWDLGGKTAAGAGAGAIAGATIGSVVPGVGTAVGAVIGAVGGTILGYATTADGAPNEIVKNIIKKCRTERKTFTKPTKSQARLSAIAGDIRKALSGWGWTNLEDLQRAIASCENIVDFCNVTYVYSNTFGESLWNALDGDIDANEEWSKYVLRPLRKLAKQTKTINPNQTKQQLTPEEKRLKAKTCGYSSWDKYKNSGWKCKTKQGETNTGETNAGGGETNTGGGGETYPFDYDTILKSFPPEEIVNPYGQGGEDETQTVTVTDKMYSAA